MVLKLVLLALPSEVRTRAIHCSGLFNICGVDFRKVSQNDLSARLY